MIALPDRIQYVLQRLQAAGFSAYAVGGCVRDHLLETTPKDYDVTTAALPEQTMAVFAEHRILKTGLQHGTVTLLLDDLPIEITTYRVDEGYTDHRHPDAVRFTRDFREDAARRDFTMNAIGYNDTDGLRDPFGGREDIAARRIRAVGNAEARFTEDALRILRALRFSAVLDFSIEEKTAAAIVSCKHLLKEVSAERIATELKKLLTGTAVRRVLLEYAEVFAVILPELSATIGFHQHNPHHIYTVYEHCAAATEAIPPRADLRLAAFLHDIGKPACFFTDDAGVGHFYGHPAAGAAAAANILTRLRFDTATKDHVTMLIRAHDIMIEDTDKAVKRALNRLSPEGFCDLLALKRADCLAQHPDYHVRLPYYDALQQRAARILAERQCFSLRDLAVNGNDLLARGLHGKQIGDALADLLERVIDGTLPNEKDALLRALPQDHA